jgi:hypothetical protein
MVIMHYMFVQHLFPDAGNMINDILRTGLTSSNEPEAHSPNDGPSVNHKNLTTEQKKSCRPHICVHTSPRIITDINIIPRFYEVLLDRHMPSFDAFVRT